MMIPRRRMRSGVLCCIFIVWLSSVLGALPCASACLSYEPARLIEPAHKAQVRQLTGAEEVAALPVAGAQGTKGVPFGGGEHGVGSRGRCLWRPCATGASGALVPPGFPALARWGSESGK